MSRVRFVFYSLLAAIPAAFLFGGDFDLVAEGRLAIPNTPIITEPAEDGQVVHSADVHMETAPFSDPDPGDKHGCTEWEIWRVTSIERVWIARQCNGPERVHIHLGDGVFENSHADRTALLYDTEYRLRVRHQDKKGEWSHWAERFFQTGEPSEVLPLALSDVFDLPHPEWAGTSGAAVVLPAGTPQPFLRLESAASELLLEFRGRDGVTNHVLNPSPLSNHASIRVHIYTGSLGGDLVLPESTITIYSTNGVPYGIYLPPINLAPGQELYLWVSANGSTYAGSAGQTEPDFSTPVRSTPVPWRVLQPGYKVEIVATGFQLPVNIAFIPNPGPNQSDPLFYVTELYGTIKVVSREGAVSDYATDLLNYNPTGNFPGSGEQGLTGIVVDPATGDVYASMLYSRIPYIDRAAHYPKVVRLQSIDGGRNAHSQTVILDMIGETQGASHQISNLTIGRDEKLYVHMGDGFNVGTALNLESFRGKILRLNLDGTAASDNPFYNSSDGISARDYIYAYGFRNPFGGAWRASDGFHYEVENGPATDRFAKVVRGTSYGWNGNDSNMTINAIYNWHPAHVPVNLAFIQSSTFGGSGFPPEMMDHAFVTESGPTWATGPQVRGKRIVEFVLDGNSELVSGPTTLLEYNGSGQATAVALAAGPDGLYFSDLYKDLDYSSAIDRGAKILRVRFAGVPDFAANVTYLPIVYAR